MALFSFVKTIMASLFKADVTVRHPVSPLPNASAVRGHVAIEIEKCIFCGICQKKCPTGAIEVCKTEKTWTIDRFDCIQCGCCAENCPKACLRMDSRQPPVSRTPAREVVKDA